MCWKINRNRVRVYGLRIKKKIKIKLHPWHVGKATKCFTIYIPIIIIYITYIQDISPNILTLFVLNNRYIFNEFWFFLDFFGFLFGTIIFLNTSWYSDFLKLFKKLQDCGEPNFFFQMRYLVKCFFFAVKQMIFWMILIYYPNWILTSRYLCFLVVKCVYSKDSKDSKDIVLVEMLTVPIG